MRVSLNIDLHLDRTSELRAGREN